MNYKNAISLVLFLFLTIGAANAQEMTTITGIWDGKTEGVNLYKVDNGGLVELSSSKLDDNKRFNLAITHDEAGFYVLGQNEASKSNNYTFYLKPGDRLNVNITNIKYEYELVGNNNSPENVELKHWFDAFKPVDFMAIYFFRETKSYVDFFPVLDEFVETFDNYTIKEAVDKEFVTKFESYRKFELAHAALVFLYTPKSAHPQGEDFSDYYKTLDFKKLSASADILSYPYGVNLIEMARMFARTYPIKKGYPTPAVMLDEDISLVGNNIMQGELVSNVAVRIPAYDEFVVFDKKYGKYLFTDKQKEKVKEHSYKLATVADGAKAIDFKFKDKDGKDVALSDFAGKVVYIDVWATWCGPCLKEAPHWAKLYDEYKNKDIVFLGVSIDSEKDHGKWLKHLEKEGAIGVQIFAGDKADDIKKPYNIKGIPHFLLIGKDGNIVSANAPRPSMPEVKIMLDSALNR